MRYELVIKVGSYKELKFESDTIKNVVGVAIQTLAAEYGNQAFLNEAFKKWKKNQFFFRSTSISSELNKI